MIWQTVIFCVLLLIMWTIVILLVWQDGRDQKKKGTAMKDNDLISRSALLEKAIGVVVYDEGGWNCNVRAVPDDVVEKAPAVDAVEVVRCKDCKYRCETKEGEYNPEDIVCDWWATDGLKANDFCSYGERRGGDGSDH